MANLYASVHAAERFRDRHAPGLSYAHALRELRVLIDTARRTKARTRSGEEIWITGTRDEVILVVAPDRIAHKRPTVVTVLHRDDAHSELGAAGELTPEEDTHHHDEGSPQ